MVPDAILLAAPMSLAARLSVREDVGIFFDGRGGTEPEMALEEEDGGGVGIEEGGGDGRGG